MSSPLARHRRAFGLVPILLVAVSAIVAMQIASFGHSANHGARTSTTVAAAYQHAPDRRHVDTTTTTTSTVPPTTTTTSTTAPPPPPAPAATTPPPPAAAQATPAPQTTRASAVAPSPQEASVWSCGAAVAYLSAHAFPGFTFECPGNAQGREGMTCLNEPGVCPGEAIIAIAEPCPAAYMNEASNSWEIGRAHV